MQQERSLILLSCSRDKRSGGVEFDERCRRLTQPRFLPSLYKDLIARRKKIFELLKGVTGRLQNEDQQGGFRHERRSNKALVYGPDLGGVDFSRAGYLRAFERYSGRFFTALSEAAPEFWNGLHQRPVEILFVSGLYGLLFFDEMIQDYDCHMGDFIEGSDPRETVANLWRWMLTDILSQYINEQRKQGRPIRHVFDLLSDDLYREPFGWDRVESMPGVRVHHRVFRPISGTDALPYIAQLIAQDFSRFYEDSHVFEDGKMVQVQTQIGRNSRGKF